ncbi:MAG TPA: type III-B CRISPR module RAMP protein Cmr4 [Spirochaetales bacterium]|nr:type III-B CRISPR module RAMP protein Cmr4 [Spirochaetales bacterium]HQK33098.1 type III-B CRISPR module RAMP protein Cmr4 [Spirochaetales bacterium]
MLKRELTSIVTYYGISPIHAGAGSSTSVVDLPIQRERHTNWPHIQASSVKGALRQHFRRFAENEVKDGRKAREFINYIFGNDSDNDKDYPIKDAKTERLSNTAGIISVSDAKLLAFPMRSNIAPFVHVTCPAVLKRLIDDLVFCGFEMNEIAIPTTIQNEKAIVLKSVNGSFNLQEKILLEDLVVEINGSNNLNAINEYITQIENLLLISDEDFNYCVSYCTEIQTQIKIDTATGTAKDRALRYQELLPANTLLYSVVYYSASAFDTDLQAKTVKETVENGIKSFVQIGGDETLGRGICKIEWHSFNRQGA